MLKNLLLRNCNKVDEADNFYTCLCHFPLHKLIFCIGKVRTMVAVATF